MKNASEWATELGTSGNLNHTLETIESIQADAYKAGQTATMKWVSEECKKMLASIPNESHHHHAE